VSKALTLSIVIPVYNEEDHLKACLDSIAQQSEKPNEVILVDNNSTDKTVEIAKSYKFIRVVKEDKQGIVFARDKGFNAVKYDIIARIDADTRLPVNWVERVKSFYKNEENKNNALTGGGYFYNVRLPRVNGWILGQIAYRMNRMLLGHYIVWGSNMALPHKLWQDVKGFVCHRNDIHEDLDLAIHLHRKGHEITYIENLRVGIKMRRVRSDQLKLWDNQRLWPQTLRVHGRWTWVFGWLGAAFLTFIGAPIVRTAELIARLSGRKSLSE
jgi:glycosyltransferase involved in cell wall biosynthesis